MLASCSRSNSCAATSSPSRCRLAAISCTLEPGKSPITTRAPSRARRRAVADPIAPAPPLMNATLPFKASWISLIGISVLATGSANGPLAHNVAQGSYAFDGRFDHIAGSEEAAGTVARAGRRSGEQHITALETRTLVDETDQFRYV